jgi:hypothetical protein
MSQLTTLRNIRKLFLTGVPELDQFTYVNNGVMVFDPFCMITYDNIEGNYVLSISFDLETEATVAANIMVTLYEAGYKPTVFEPYYADKDDKILFDEEARKELAKNNYINVN